MSRSEIRPARSADLGRILEIESAWATTPHWSREHFEAELSSERSCFLVIEEDGLVAAYAVLWKVPPEGQLQTIAVATEASRRGLGRRNNVADRPALSCHGGRDPAGALHGLSIGAAG